MHLLMKQGGKPIVRSGKGNRGGPKEKRYSAYIDLKQILVQDQKKYNARVVQRTRTIPLEGKKKPTESPGSSRN